FSPENTNLESRKLIPTRIDEVKARAARDRVNKIPIANRLEKDKRDLVEAELTIDRRTHPHVVLWNSLSPEEQQRMLYIDKEMSMPSTLASIDEFVESKVAMDLQHPLRIIMTNGSLDALTAGIAIGEDEAAYQFTSMITYQECSLKNAEHFTISADPERFAK